MHRFCVYHGNRISRWLIAQAGLRAFFLSFPITQRDAIC